MYAYGEENLYGEENFHTGKRTFKYAGTIHFNFLPAHIKTAPSFSNFKSLLIKHYYS